jgi:predicted Ser/Thr protein kinase
MSLVELGPYRIDRELGSGGMGTVYLAVHRDTGRPVALKVLPPSLAREPGFVARFQREIDVLKTLKSPHIVELYEQGVDNETYYFAMEYVAGENLTERLERQERIPWRDAIDIAAQVCKALKAAHNAGVIHRDLKPSNLLLAEGNLVKLSDFGVAQLFAGGRLTATGGMIGTAEYMSPEQASGRRATKQSDIYSLGAVLYAMLTGRPPFSGKSAVDIMQKHKFGLFDSPRRIVPEIPQWLDDLVCQCLEKDPDKRFPDAYVLSLRLSEIPHKVDLAAGAAGNSGELTNEAVADTQVPEANPQAAGAEPIGATLVRDLMRAEIDAQARGTPLERWLDKTWVLWTLLAIVIGGGIWLYRSTIPDPAKLFAEGEALMAGSRNSDWLHARDECFLPLLEIDEVTWEPRVVPYLRLIEIAAAEEAVARVTRRGRVTAEPTSEPLRVLDDVRRDVADGRIGSARQRLRALRAIVTAVPTESIPQREREVLTAVVDSLLESLPPERPIAEQPLFAALLEQARQLRQAGDDAEAERILNHLAELYSDSPLLLDAIAAERDATATPAE